MRMRACGAEKPQGLRRRLQRCSQRHDLTRAVLERVLNDDNFYIRQRAAGKEADPLILAQLRESLKLCRAASDPPFAGPAGLAAEKLTFSSL